MRTVRLNSELRMDVHESDWKKFKKELKKQGVKIKDVREYEDAHPICSKVQTACGRWAPVAEFTSKFLTPAAIAGSATLVKPTTKVVSP